MTTTPKTAQAGLPALLPCPFCGLEPKQSDWPDSYSPTKHVWFIACFCGGYSACAHKMGETQSEVLTKWNTRAAQAAQPAAPTGDVHSCSLFCDNPACIKQQRDEMRERKALSDADLREAARSLSDFHCDSVRHIWTSSVMFARAIEAAHGITATPQGKI